jgi:beta-fructofuranosidase
MLSRVVKEGIFMKNLFYKPKGAWAGDFIPYYKDGRFRIFYLHDWRDKENHGEGTAWYQVSTDNFVDYKEHGEMISRGKINEQDLYVFTGSVIESDGLYHIFYTGHNPYFPQQGKPTQGVMHAISQDLEHWIKVEEDTFYSPNDIYEIHDWRDPFVFWNEDENEFWMLLAARLKEGPSRRRGCIALCASRDLKKWEVREPFWSPSLYYTHECPDLFKIGDWWYLVYSTFSERHITHYRMSKTLNGSWIAPTNDSFDGRAYYAAKTFSDGEKRYIFGWNPTKEGNRDEGKWQWGGNLVVHEIIQQPDGSLSVKIPDTIDKKFSICHSNTFDILEGNWIIKNKEIFANAKDSYAYAIAGDMARKCKIEGNIAFDENTYSCGIILRLQEDMDSGYYIRLEPKHNRLVFDLWPRKGDCPFAVELERPIRLEAGQPYNIKIVIDDTVGIVYLDEKVAMNFRLYDFPKGKWGIFVSEGTAKFDNIGLWVE